MDQLIYLRGFSADICVSFFFPLILAEKVRRSLGLIKINQSAGFFLRISALAFFSADSRGKGAQIFNLIWWPIEIFAPYVRGTIRRLGETFSRL